MPEAVTDKLRDILNMLDKVDRVDTDCFDPVSSQNYHITGYKVGSVTRLDIKNA